MFSQQPACLVGYGKVVRQHQQVSWLLSDACPWCVGLAG